MKLRDTIKAKDGYRVRRVIHVITGEEAWRVDDGDHPVMLVQKRSWEEYLDERENNEEFYIFEIFTTVKGNQYIYWTDSMGDPEGDFITLVPKEDKNEVK